MSLSDLAGSLCSHGNSASLHISSRDTFVERERKRERERAKGDEMRGRLTLEQSRSGLAIPTSW